MLSKIFAVSLVAFSHATLAPTQTPTQTPTETPTKMPTSLPTTPTSFPSRAPTSPSSPTNEGTSCCMGVCCYAQGVSPAYTCSNTANVCFFGKQVKGSSCGPASYLCGPQMTSSADVCARSIMISAAILFAIHLLLV